MVKVRCKCCNVVLDSKYGFQTCPCKRIFIDSDDFGVTYRVGGDEGDYEYVE